MKEDFLKDRLDAAARIRQIREEAGLTQEQFAEILEISVSAYKKIESAENQISLNGLRQLGRKMQVSADYVLFGTNESPDVAWEMIQNCSESDKMYLLIKLLIYFTRIKKSALYVKDKQEEFDKVIFKVMDEIQNLKKD